MALEVWEVYQWETTAQEVYDDLIGVQPYYEELKLSQDYVQSTKEEDESSK
jgi:hypothetical protein